MNKIIEAEDILFDAQNCVECIFMATASLSHEEAHPLQAVADIASKKITEAIAFLDEYRAGAALRLRYLTWKLRALCWVLRRLRAGAFLGPRDGEFAAKNKQSCHCENDYSWQHIRHEGILRRFRWQAGEAFDRKGQPHAPPATKRTSPRPDTS